MLYTVGCSGKPGINDRTTFIELGYQFTEAGGTLVGLFFSLSSCLERRDITPEMEREQ